MGALYDPGGACEPEAHVGRQMLLRSLENGLTNGRSFVLAGGPGIGKTSTLRALDAAIRVPWRRQPGKTKLVPVHLDGRAWPEDDAGSVTYIWNALLAAVTEPSVMGPRPLKQRVELKLNRTDDPYRQLEAKLTELTRLLRGTIGWSRYTLLIDDADTLTERSHEKHLRQLVDLGDLARWKPTGILLAGGRLLRESLRERRAPMRDARVMSLGVLRQAEAETLIQRGFPGYAERNRAALQALSGNHPWILTRLLAELEARGGAGDPRAVARELGPAFEPLFDRIWDALDMGRQVTYRGAYAAPEHALLQYAVDLRSPVSVRDAERDLALRPLKEYAELLSYIGIAETQLAGDVPQLRAGVELFNDWYGRRITQ